MSVARGIDHRDFSNLCKTIESFGFEMKYYHSPDRLKVVATKDKTAIVIISSKEIVYYDIESIKVTGDGFSLNLFTMDLFRNWLKKQ